ncbi:hypothetical protein JRC42_24135 (plasmid) [Escherichia albertii]|uniref:hypothetical protein n=1 Tax=Escherichia albertii TaxID=208962 RepID=UPI00195D7D0B|nr:hypothetical protein [Escherichia albertii]QST30940.1 hypothetical protein JRC42_24135 [Escherichia albertii]QST40253.1 hypothetical protein JRC46_24930 [Escherichia albertii]
MEIIRLTEGEFDLVDLHVKDTVIGGQTVCRQIVTHSDRTVCQISADGKRLVRTGFSQKQFERDSVPRDRKPAVEGGLVITVLLSDLQGEILPGTTYQ